jgi:TolB-like protein/DNA-binding winged helix-turn-helix (wHTH) protein
MNDSDTQPRLLRFGVFEVDLRTGELRKQGLKVKLHGQPFQILALLLERPGEPVTREEIREKLWAGDTFIDFEHSVNSSIKRLREALGDAAERPRYIETLPRHGYRFIAPVEPVAPVHTPAVDVGAESPRRPPVLQTRERPQGAPLRKRWIVPRAAGALVALLAVSLALNVASLRDRLLTSVAPRHSVSTPKIESIAVLPLENLSHDPEQEYFADGMTDELITNLGKVSALRVISRTSVMRYKGTKKPLPEIAQELNVDAVVEGAVLRSGERVRVTANLVHARTDRHLWAESYERDLRDVLSLQSEVARAITSEIQIKVTPQEQARLASARSVNPEAYRLYLQARYYFSRRTLPAFDKSIQLFQQVLEKEPNSALAYAGLAESYGILPFYSGAPSKEAFPKAKVAARKAVELDNSLAEAHAALGFVLLYWDWDWLAAESELKRAIELKPSYVVGHHWYAEYLSAMARHDRAVAEIKRAQELDPLSPLMLAIGGEVCDYGRRYDEAIEQCRKALELDPNYALAHRNLARAFLGKRMHEEAASEYVKADRAWGNAYPLELALAHAARGNRDEALKILREQSSQPKFDPETAVLVYLALGEKQEALDWVEKAYEEHDPYAAFWNVNPALDPLRSAPRFQAILRRMNFPP